MTTIYQLSALDELQDGDQFPMYSIDNGDTRRVALSLISKFIQENLTVGVLRNVHVTPPSAPGFAISVESNTHMIFTADAGFSSGQFTMPLSPVNNDEFLFTTNQALGGLTYVVPSGQLMAGAPSGMSANTFFRLKYDGVLSTWRRVG